MKRLTFIVIIIGFLTGCSVFYRSVEKPSENFLHVLKYRSKEISPNFNTNGIYVSLTTEVEENIAKREASKNETVIDRFIIFYDNGLFAFNSSSFQEFNENGLAEHIVRLANVGRYTSYINWGTYYREQDKVIGYAYVSFWGHGDTQEVFRICRFEGKIGEQQIYDWKLTGEKPEFKKNLQQQANIEKLKWLSASQKFVWKSFPEKHLLDSNNVWINKYREQ